MRAAVVVLLVAGCGTYSMVRPATTLPPGKVELALGVSASPLEVNTVAHAALGLADRVEILGQNEIWNTFGEIRFAVLKPSDSPVSLVVGAGGGYAVTFLSAVTSDLHTGAAADASISIGHDFGRVALTLANRTFALTGGYLASSTRGAVRVRLGRHVGVFVEGGATIHAPIDDVGLALAIGEGTGGFYLGF